MAELLAQIAADPGMDRALAVEEPEASGGAEDTLVPDIGMDVEAARPVAPQGDDVFRLQVVAGQRHGHNEVVLQQQFIDLRDNALECALVVADVFVGNDPVDIDHDHVRDTFDAIVAGNRTAPGR